MTRGIDHLIINSPFEEPSRHGAYDRERQRFYRKEGRRPAGYVRATTSRAPTAGTAGTTTSWTLPARSPA
jgi:hypothetical protein